MLFPQGGVMRAATQETGRWVRASQTAHEGSPAVFGKSGLCRVDPDGMPRYRLWQIYLCCEGAFALNLGGTAIFSPQGSLRVILGFLFSVQMHFQESDFGHLLTQRMTVSDDFIWAAS